MGKEKTIEIKIPVYRDVRLSGAIEGPHQATATITDDRIRIDDGVHTLIDGEYKLVLPSNDCAHVFEILNSPAKFVVLLGMDVGSPFADTATAKLAYVYF